MTWGFGTTNNIIIQTTTKETKIACIEAANIPAHTVSLFLFLFQPKSTSLIFPWILFMSCIYLEEHCLFVICFDVFLSENKHFI